MIEKLKGNRVLWDRYTRREEYENPLRDSYGRFCYYMSAERDILRPTVSEHLIRTGFEPQYPEDRRFAVCLTHDIDEVYPSRKRCLLNVMKYGKSRQLKKTAGNLLTAVAGARSEWWNFRETIELEERYAAKSTFFFLALRPGEKDRTYDVSDLLDDLGTISDRGWEVGLHGGHTAYENYSELLSQKKLLEKTLGRKVKGYRNHFLRFRVPETWENLAKAGFEYDTSLGYPDMVGFRSGMCHPYRPYNLNCGKEIDIVEIPLTVMDSALFNRMNLDQKTGLDLVKKLVDAVAQNRGVFTLLWHNTFMVGEMKKVYEDILSYCAEKGAWMTSGEEILRSFR